MKFPWQSKLTGEEFFHFKLFDLFIFVQPSQCMRHFHRSCSLSKVEGQRM